MGTDQFSAGFVARALHSGEPVFDRLPERIEAYASICFEALIQFRVMRHSA